MMELCTTEMFATYAARARFQWPEHAGSLLRGILGRALRLHACARPAAPCAQACKRPQECTYARLFDPPPCASPPHPLLANTARPPAPMVLLVPAPGERTLEAGSSGGALVRGDRVEMGVRLLGSRSAREIDAMVAALESAEELSVGTGGGAWALQEIRQPGARNRPIAIDPPDQPVDRLCIEFVTPAWIEVRGRVSEEVTFQGLFRSLARRITTVTALHGALPGDHDSTFVGLDKAAAEARVTGRRLRLVSWERLSLERGERHTLRGLLGAIEVEGDLTALVPWLRWGEILHVGKATSFGLGRMRLVIG